MVIFAVAEAICCVDWSVLVNSTVTVLGSGALPGAVYVAPTLPEGMTVPTTASPWIELFTYQTRRNPGLSFVKGTEVSFPGAARQSGSSTQLSGGDGSAPRA